MGTWRDLCQVPSWFFVAASRGLRRRKICQFRGQMIPHDSSILSTWRMLKEAQGTVWVGFPRPYMAIISTFWDVWIRNFFTVDESTPMFGTGRMVIINLARDHWCLQLTKWSTPNKKKIVRFLGNQSGHPSFQLLIQIGSQHFLHFLHFTATVSWQLRICPYCRLHHASQWISHQWVIRHRNCSLRIPESANIPFLWLDEIPHVHFSI